MKRISILCILISVLLCGCWKVQTGKVICEDLNDGYNTKRNYVYYYAGIDGKKNTQSETITVNGNIHRIGKEKEDVLKEVEELKKELNQEGMSYTFTLDEEGNFEEVVTMDYDKLELDYFYELDLVSGRQWIGINEYLEANYIGQLRQLETCTCEDIVDE